MRSCHQSGQLNRFYKHKQTSSMKNDAITTKQSNNISIALLVLIDWPKRFKYKDVKIQYVTFKSKQKEFFCVIGQLKSTRQ